MHGLIGVTGAGGHALPYLGYIEVDVNLDGNTLAALVLVVPETDYHHSTPGLLGNNIIASVQLKPDTPEASTDRWSCKILCDYSSTNCYCGT